MSRGKLACLAAVEPRDLGFDDEALDELSRAGELPHLAALLGGREASEPRAALSESTRRLLRSSAAWRAGCAALEKGQAARALAAFDQAASEAPAGVIQPLSAALALARLEKWEEADARLAQLAPALRDDPRYAAASALVGLARGDMDQAEVALASSGTGGPAAAPGPRLAEQYFFVMLWKGAWDRAEEYARRMAEAAEVRGESAALWQERVGDAAFLGGDAARALAWYEKSYAAQPGSALLATKLSDVHFKLGDLERERRYREAVYGSLRDDD
jgi:hypothetical protein